MWTIWAGVAMAGIAHVSAAFAAAPKVPVVPTSAGTHQLELVVDGVSRRYTVHLPARRKAPRPVVVALHYGGHGAANYATGFVDQLVVPGLGGLDAIIVAPDCPGASWSDPVSETVVLALLDHALAAWGADSKRVVLMGFSMGGMGTWHLGARHPQRFSVLLPVAGAPDPPDGVDAIAASVPVYAIGGTRDTVIDQAPTTAAIGRLTALGKPAVWVQLDLSHYETASYVPALRDAVPWIVARWE